MLKVFEFSYEIDCGGGIMLVAAKDLEQAEKIVNDIPVGFGHWIYECEHTELNCNWLRPGVITSFTRGE